MRRADRVRQRLGWKPGMLNGHGEMPRGMHGPTFFRLIAVYEKHVQVALAAHGRWAECFQRRETFATDLRRPVLRGAAP